MLTDHNLHYQTVWKQLSISAFIEQNLCWWYFKSLSLELSFFSSKFSVVAKFLLASTHLLHPFVGPSADNIVHGALLKVERFVRCDYWQVKPSPSSFCRTSLQFRPQRVSWWVVTQKICKNVNLGITHHYHSSIHNSSFNCCLFAKPSLDLDHCPTIKSYKAL